MFKTIQIRLKSVGKTYRISQSEGIARFGIFIYSVNHKPFAKLIYVLKKQ